MLLKQHLRYFYLPNNVLSLTDKATMAASVEGRVPLLDHRVVEFAFSWKKEINILDGEQKGLFKKVLTNLLPKKLLWRKKEGFNSPIGKWIVEDKNFKELTISLLNTNFIKSIIKKEIVNDLLKKHINGLEDNSFKIFNLIVLSQWVEDKKLNL